jgi:hypothetical protein
VILKPAGRAALCLCGALNFCFSGCGESASTTRSPPAANPTASTPDEDISGETTSERPKSKRAGPIQLGGAETASSTKAEAAPESIVAALKPLQVLLGQWNGLSRNNRTDEPEWVWDFQTDRQQPSLVLTSEQGEHLRRAQLTFLPEADEYQLTATDGDGRRRVYRGKFSEPVQDVPGDNDELQRTFKLELTETEPSTAGEIWQLVLAQQENNRYLLEVNRRRGAGGFVRIDTVHTQRAGTSFALSSTDYGDKTCVISQGLGTISVSYQGKTYWVCCTGCKAAFEEEPERWIARYE